jgi:hypothetical protein
MMLRTSAKASPEIVPDEAWRATREPCLEEVDVKKSFWRKAYA